MGVARTQSLLLLLLAIHKVQGNPRSARGPCTCAGASHRVARTGYCATVINGAVHSKYTEENQLTLSASQTVAKLIVNQGFSYRAVKKC